MATFKNTRATSLVIERVAGSLGARVKGVQISGNLDEDTIIAIKAALHEHKVIFFRAQTHLNDDEQQRITERLGPPFEMPTLPDDVIARDGAMYELDGSKPDGRAVSWHTDATFCHTPPSASVLRGVVIPPYGGDTQWANCVRALEILPAPLRTLAEQLSVVHTHKVSDAISICMRARKIRNILRGLQRRTRRLCSIQWSIFIRLPAKNRSCWEITLNKSSTSQRQTPAASLTCSRTTLLRRKIQSAGPGRQVTW